MVSILHGQCTTNAQDKPDNEFNPTIAGRISANGVVAYGNEFHFSLSTPGPAAYAETGLWVIQTVDNCYIRCGISGNPNTTNQWYNTSGVGQGAPGVITGAGTTIFTLGELCDEVRIDHTEVTTLGTPTFNNVSSTYTDNTFFTPTQDAKYGRTVDAYMTSAPDPATPDDGRIQLAVTFRKSGKNDYTITFEGRARALSEWGF